MPEAVDHIEAPTPLVFVRAYYSGDCATRVRFVIEVAAADGQVRFSGSEFRNAVLAASGCAADYQGSVPLRELNPDTGSPHR